MGLYSGSTGQNGHTEGILPNFDEFCLGAIWGFEFFRYARGEGNGQSFLWKFALTIRIKSVIFVRIERKLWKQN